MRRRKVTVTNASGLHARPAAALVQAAQRFASAIRIDAEGRTADAKSILEVLTLGVERGGQVAVTAEGPDEDVAIRTLVDLIAGGLEEPSPVRR